MIPRGRSLSCRKKMRNGAVRVHLGVLWIGMGGLWLFCSGTALHHIDAATAAGLVSGW